MSWEMIVYPWVVCFGVIPISCLWPFSIPSTYWDIALDAEWHFSIYSLLWILMDTIRQRQNRNTIVRRRPCCLPEHTALKQNNIKRSVLGLAVQLFIRDQNVQQWCAAFNWQPLGIRNRQLCITDICIDCILTTAKQNLTTFRLF